jgi:hypothetical protein
VVEIKPAELVQVKEENGKEDKAEKRKRRGFSDMPPEEVEPPKKIKGDNLIHWNSYC